MPTIKVDGDTYFVDQKTADDWKRSLPPRDAAGSASGSDRTWTRLTASTKDEK